MYINKNSLQACSRKPASVVLQLQLKTPSSGYVALGGRGLTLAFLACFTMGSGISRATPPAHTGPGTSLGSYAANSETWAKGRILVMPRAGLPEHEFARILGEHGGKARKIGQSSLHILDLPAHPSEQAVAAR